MPSNATAETRSEQSFRHSIKDASAYAVMMGIGETYLSAFALFLKASTPQIGLLSSLPPLLGSLAQILSAVLGRTFGLRKPIMLVGAGLQAFAWLPIMLLPLLFPEAAVPLLITAVVIYHCGAHLAAPQWASLMGDLIPMKTRGRFFARRTRIISLVTFLSLAAGGLLLNESSAAGYTVAGFIVLFSVAMIARAISVYHLSRMHDPAGHVTDLRIPATTSWWRRLANSNFARFSIFYALMQFSVAVSSPFFAVYMLRDLQFSYAQFMANTGMSVLVQFLTLRYWGRIGDVMGNRLVLRTTGLVIPALPALWMVSGNFWYLLLVQALSGFAWAGFSLSAGNILYDLVPREKRATYQALQNVVMTAGVFLGSMLGVAVTHHLPAELDFGPLRLSLPSALMWAFMFSALARLFVSALLLGRLPEPRRPRQSASPYQLVYRFTRFNAFSGLLYDIVARVRRTDDDQG